MTVTQKLILFVSVGFALVLLAAFLPVLSATWRGALVIGGGWLMAIGGLFQVKEFSLRRDVAYYVMLALVGLYWVALLGITFYWLATLAGWI
ncbi:hypothetical protein IC229_22795 [Spirosoma sp. BT702]|uniref:Uncharacterized protein n=1 Tax=Spirosoma profusum TaxID=2771354 RepID=A0A926Y4R6_9BACT|nr:hypothetical protein [Spirosoma profusum]MBD2703491.1 hypothetical protein [Spirosoma profusum]